MRLYRERLVYHRFILVLILTRIKFWCLFLTHTMCNYLLNHPCGENLVRRVYCIDPLILMSEIFNITVNSYYVVSVGGNCFLWTIFKMLLHLPLILRWLVKTCERITWEAHTIDGLVQDWRITIANAIDILVFLKLSTSPTLFPSCTLSSRLMVIFCLWPTFTNMV